jgi:DNA-binding LacI/PurR family transcriptional regulator
MSKRVTSHDVARRAGVSRTTVSLVLNRSDAATFSPETRERVLQAATDLGYKPNSAARMLVSGNSETIGLVISNKDILSVDAFVPQVLHGIGEVNQRHGFHVLLESLASGPGSGTYDHLVESRRIDGLILLNPRQDDEALKTLIEHKFPIVLVGTMRHPEEASINYSASASTRQAVDLLVDLGHRNVGMVAFAPPGFVAVEGRKEALRRALAAHDLDLPDTAVEYANFSAESGHVATRALLTRRPDVTAVFAGNDTIAIGVISAARALGRRVPEDLSVVGHDDLPFAAWLSPGLTTIRNDAVRQGALAAEMLISILQGKPIAERRVRLQSELIVRQSCAAAPR